MPKQKDITAIVAAYWPVIAALFTIAAAWGTSTTQIVGAREDLKTIVEKIDKVADSLTAARVDIATGKAKSEANSVSITDLSERMRAQEARR